MISERMPHPERRREKAMITNAASGRKTDLDTRKSPINSSKDAMRQCAPQARDGAPGQAQAGHAASAGSAPDWTYDSQRSLTAKTTEDLYLKYTTRDGDVLEIHSETTEEIRYDESVRVGAGGKRPAVGDAEASDGAGAAEETDPKKKQLAELRKWAEQVEREVRAQQHKILEQMLKQSGRHLDMGDGRFVALFPECAIDGAVKAATGKRPEQPRRTGMNSFRLIGTRRILQIGLCILPRRWRKSREWIRRNSPKPSRKR
jgi:hypothetical protein